MADLIDQTYFNDNMTQLGLKATFTPLPDALGVLISDASEWVQNYCDRVLVASAVSEYVRMRSPWNRMILDQYPINSIASVAFESDDGSVATYDVSKFRILPGGVIEFKNPVNGPFRTDGTYIVTYNAGYSVVPSNVKRATALKVADLLRPQYQGPSDREVNMVSDIEEKVIDLLEHYRRERLG